MPRIAIIGGGISGLSAAFTLEEKRQSGVEIGFLCDHVEVLYDIDIFFKQFAEKEGMRLWRAESLNGSKTLTAALAELVRGRVRAIGIEQRGRGSLRSG
jgi:protoporphyrin/coproporphyrin ferrochelatase